MSKKTLFACIILSCLLPDAGYATVAVRPFRERARCADIVIEGVVLSQEDIESDRTDLRSYRKKSVVEVTKIYKGAMDGGSKVTVYSHMNFVCDTSQILTRGRRYLLMLENYESDYADANHGRGIWEIVSDHAGQKVVIDSVSKRPQPYTQCIHNVNWAIEEPPQWSDEPAMSYEQAKKIALEKLAKAHVSLEGLEYKKQDPPLIKLRYDTIGKYYKDDPVWVFQWIKPEFSDDGSPLLRTYVKCYAHTHTGDFDYNESHNRRQSLERSESHETWLLWLRQRHRALLKASEFMNVEFPPKHYGPHFNNKLSVVTKDGKTTKLRYYITKETVYLGDADKYPFNKEDIYIEYDIASEEWSLLWPKNNNAASTASPNKIFKEDKSGNFVLYVSNQSFAVNPVDIQVFVDDEKVIDQIFDVSGKRGVAQHNWIPFHFKASPDSYRLRAESKKGKAVLSTTFEIKDKHWAVIDYWNYPKITGGAGPTPPKFTFNIQDKPIGFE